MARTMKNKERERERERAVAAVDVGATGTRPASKGAVLILAVSVLAAIWAAAMMTSPGRVGYLYFFMYAEFYMGVISLVSLSITIMVGLVATDRLVLSIRQRVLLQSTHRTTGLIAVTALVVHVWTKVVESHIRIVDAFIPFISPTNTVYIGLGTISGWIMFLVMWTGIARARFIGRGQPWMWRSIHAISYLMWPIALVHGLSAGRPAKTWVTVSYILCILLVLVGLAVRLSVSLNRKKDFSSTAGLGAMKPAGKMVPTTAPAVKKRQARWEEPTPVAVTEGWIPAAPAPAPQPVAERDSADTRIVSRRAIQERLDRDAVLEGELEDRPRGRRRVDEEPEYDYDEPAPRGRRYADEDEPRRRAARRVEMDDTRGYQDEPPAPRQRRYAEEEPPPRGRRASHQADDGYDGYDEVPRQRSPRYADEEPAPRRGSRRESRYAEEAEEAPRARRDRGADDESAGSGRHSIAFAAPGDEGYLPPDDTPTLIDMASRRARREQRSTREQRSSRVSDVREGRQAGRADDEQYWSSLRGEAK